MLVLYQLKEILKKYKEEIEGVKKDSIVLGKHEYMYLVSCMCL